MLERLWFDFSSDEITYHLAQHPMFFGGVGKVEFTPSVHAHASYSGLRPQYALTHQGQWFSRTQSCSCSMLQP